MIGEKERSLPKPKNSVENQDFTALVSTEDNATPDSQDLMELHYGKRGRPMRLGKVKSDVVL